MTKARIDARFAALKAEGRAAFVAYVMAGDPDAATALAIVKGLPAAGADIIELGFPFSDPMAEGPPIQRAAQRALAKGIHRLVFDRNGFRYTGRVAAISKVAHEMGLLSKEGYTGAASAEPAGEQE